MIDNYGLFFPRFAKEGYTGQRPNRTWGHTGMLRVSKTG